MKFAIASLLLLVPTSLYALAPALSSQISNAAVTAPNAFSTEDDDTANLGIAECENYVRNNTVVVGTFTPSGFDPTTDTNYIIGYYTFDVERDSTTQIQCADGGLCEEIDDNEVAESATQLVVRVEFTELVGTEGVTCEGFDNEYFIRVETRDPDDEDGSINGNDVKIVVDAIRPTAPTNLEASATESGIAVDFTGVDDDDLDLYYVFYSTDAFAEGDVEPDGAEIGLVSSVEGDTDGRIDADLLPGQRYFIGVAARDENGNYGPVSNVIETEALETQDFWEVYREAGGAEDGCATASPSNLLPLLALFGLLGFRRRRKLAVVTFATLLLASGVASAETPKYGSFEFKLGGYYPSIDDEFGGTGPYAQVFGTSSTIMGEFEIDGYLWQGPVDLGVGVNFGYASHTGDAVTPDGQSTPDTTKITYFPLRVAGVARLDYFAEEFGIPFVPNFKLGLDLYRWRVADGNGDTAEADGIRGAGWKTGWHTSFGLQFLLDFLAPGMASEMDLHFGVNNSYIFAEYLITQIDGFGGDGLDLSDNQLMFGLAFEF